MNSARREKSCELHDVMCSATPKALNAETRYGQLLSYAQAQAQTAHNIKPLSVLALFRHVPVTIETFIDSEDYLGGKINLWPALWDDLVAMNPDFLTGENQIHSIYLGGGTGTGKSTLARLSILYRLYLLCCLRDPQKILGLEPGTRLVIPLISVDFPIAKSVLYEPLRSLFENIPWFSKNITWNRSKTRILELGNGISIEPKPAKAEKLLGQAIPIAVLDEVNFMEVVERSKRVAGPRGQGGLYDQAEELYSELWSRQNSRFLRSPVPLRGLIVSSSARYPHDFLDRKIRDAQTLNKPNTFISTHARYDVRPQHEYAGETFRLLVGGLNSHTRILDEHEETTEGAQVINIPVEHQDDFQRDPERAIRDICGIATDNYRPFIADTTSIHDAFNLADEISLRSWTSEPIIDLTHQDLPAWEINSETVDLTKPRFIHLDLSLTRDACGIAIVHVHDFIKVPEVESMRITPMFAVDAALSILPPKNSEIEFRLLRAWIYALVDHYKIDVRSVSTDSYQSAEMRQIFKHLGMRTQEISVDRDSAPYEHLRTCFYDKRLAMRSNSVLQKELASLERIGTTGKIDHPPRGSKDVADALCGAVHAASTSRYVRGECYNRTPRKRPNPVRR